MNNGRRFEMLVVSNLPWPLPSTALRACFLKEGNRKTEFFEWRMWDFFSLLPISVTFPLLKKGD
jgi:hypothetical protein